MAHYDCTNCGASMGISFGRCDACTPPAYKRLKAELDHEVNTLGIEWDSENMPKKRAFIFENDKVKALSAKLRVLEEKYKK